MQLSQVMDSGSSNKLYRSGGKKFRTYAQGKAKKVSLQKTGNTQKEATNLWQMEGEAPEAAHFLVLVSVPAVTGIPEIARVALPLKIDK